MHRGLKIRVSAVQIRPSAPATDTTGPIPRGLQSHGSTKTMPVVDTYWKRKQRREQGEQPEVFRYDPLPDPFRVQVVLILRSALPVLKHRYQNATLRAHACWEVIQSTMCRELGVETLEPGAGNTKEGCESFIKEHPSVEKVLSLIELAFRFIEKLSPPDSKPVIGRQDPGDAIEELNTRFREHALGYEYVNGQIIEKSSEYLHAETTRQALRLLNRPGFEGPEEEFRTAYEDFLV